MKEQKTYRVVLVLRTGGDFSMCDVLLLVEHIKKYWSGGNLEIYCLHNLVRRRNELSALTLLPFPYNHWPGWWSKMNLFSPELESLRPFIYMDLDTMVLGNLQPIFEALEGEQLHMVNDFYRPGHCNSTFMYIPGNNNDQIDCTWKVWFNTPLTHMKRFRGDQDFVESTVLRRCYVQDKVNVLTTFKPARKLRKTQPKEEYIVCFHGKPRIPEAAAKFKWVNDYVSGKI